jgi:putative FmdB family regulatory protein
MPLYDYACTKCGKIREVRHGFNERFDEPCEACGSPLRRVFNAAPVLFKGSGFYVTDSRRTGSSEKAEKSKSAPASSETSTKADAPASSETKPSSKGKSDSGSKASESAA